MNKNVLLYVGLFFLLISLASIMAATDADLILFNGKIITIDPQDNIYQAVAAKDGRILRLGNSLEIKALAGPHCKMIDLNGKTVTPGLIDSHYHLMYYGAQFWPGYLNIRYPIVASKADLLRVVGDYAATLQPGEWISANQGFTLQQFETIDRWDLDAVAPHNPVYLRHSSGQYSAVNSAALDSAGITKDTPNPPGALIMRNEQGEPTGILSHYPAENLVGKYATGYGDRTDEQKFEDIDRGQELCLEAGYTSIQDVIIGNGRDIRLYKEFAEDGRLKVRVYAMLYIDYEEQADSLAQAYKPINTGLFRFGGWKLAQDGGMAARTLLFYDKSLYAAELSYPYHTQEELNRMILTLHNTGLQVAVHVSGDQGIDMTLTAFEQAMAANPRSDPRHRIEHGIFPSTAALRRFKDDQVILSTQPQWITWYGDGFHTGTNDTTMNRMLPLKTLLDTGVHLAFGCDVPASIFQEPKYAFNGAILRRATASGTIYSPQEKLTPQEALRVHTMGSAYASFAETTTGSLEIGKFADLVIWSRDLYTMPPNELINLAAEMTVVGGVIQYDAGKNPITMLSERWVAAGDMLFARTDHTATLLNNGKVLVAGYGSRQTEIYDPETDAFTASDSTLADQQQGVTATLMNDGRVLLVGSVLAPTTAELYDPATDSFSLTGSLNVAHCYHTATLLPDGKVLIAGGQDNVGPQTTAVAEIYDPTTGVFTLTDSLNVDRSGHTATLLPNGKVLIAGGSQTSTPGYGYYLNSCELYDIAAGTFQLAASLAQPRLNHAATLLNDGRVLVSCGAWYVQNGELYDPAAGIWSPTGDMTVMRRNNQTATLLRDGKVLLAGGFINAATATAELFDPVTNTFSAVDSMLAPRMLHVAVRLDDGSVLVTGGQIVGSQLKQCERYLVSIPVGIRAEQPKGGQKTPESFQLSQNFPNPFNPVTHLKYALAAPGNVRISVFNLRGEWIKTLVDAEYSAGEYRVTWDGKNAEGNQVGTGIYLVRMETGGRTACRKILFIK